MMLFIYLSRSRSFFRPLSVELKLSTCFRIPFKSYKAKFIIYNTLFRGDLRRLSICACVLRLTEKIGGDVERTVAPASFRK